MYDWGEQNQFTWVAGVVLPFLMPLPMIFAIFSKRPVRPSPPWPGRLIAALIATMMAGAAWHVVA